MTANDGDADGARVLRPLQAAACTYLIAFGLRAGQKPMTVQGAIASDADFNQKLGADMRGFIPQPAVRCGADDRQVCLRDERPSDRAASSSEL